MPKKETKKKMTKIEKVIFEELIQREEEELYRDNLEFFEFERMMSK